MWKKWKLDRPWHFVPTHFVELFLAFRNVRAINLNFKFGIFKLFILECVHTISIGMLFLVNSTRDKSQNTDGKCRAKIACQLQTGQSFIIFLEISVSIKLIVDIYMHFFNLLRMTKDFPCWCRQQYLTLSHSLDNYYHF